MLAEVGLFNESNKRKLAISGGIFEGKKKSRKKKKRGSVGE